MEYKKILTSIVEGDIPDIMEEVIASKDLGSEQKAQILKDLITMQQMGRIALARMEASD